MRESGDIEQDADVVAFLHPVEAKTSYKGTNVDLLIAKNRHGPLGKVPLVFHGGIVRFDEREVDIPADAHAQKPALPYVD
jgi:replicative DNA helicase